MIDPTLRPVFWRNTMVKQLACAVVMGIACWGMDAKAQSCAELCELYSSLLMTPERNLIGSIRRLEMLPKPPPGPRNMRGRWVQREVFLGEESFDTTFYLRSGLVQRIELVSNAPDSRCRSRSPWSAAIAALEAWKGKTTVQGQFEQDNSTQQSVHWAADEIDVSVFQTTTTENCSTKVAFKKRDVKEASQL
jgi:hypothetical protein